jgi:hypothetical protein
VDDGVRDTVSRPALGPTQPHVQRLPGALSSTVNRPVREANHLPPSDAEVKNAWSYTSTPRILIHDVVLGQTGYLLKLFYLVKQRNNFTFTLPLLYFSLPRSVHQMTTFGNLSLESHRLSALLKQF